MNKRQAKNFFLIKDIAPIFTEKDKVRRGIVHEAICKTLNMTLNNKNVHLIKKSLEEFGAREVRVRGLEYYRWDNEKLNDS